MYFNTLYYGDKKSGRRADSNLGGQNFFIPPVTRELPELRINQYAHRIQRHRLHI